MKTTAEYINSALMNAKLSLTQLNKALEDHSTPHSTHATELSEIRSDLADVIHKLERL